MSRSRARLAADWFAKLRQNAVTNVVEHTDVTDVSDDVTDVSGTALHSGSPLNAANLTGVLTGVGGSTTAGAVGTYALVIDYQSSLHTLGGTVSGSTLTAWELQSTSNRTGSVSSFTTSGSTQTQTFSGTWQWMSRGSITGTRSRLGLAVRIS